MSLLNRFYKIVLAQQFESFIYEKDYVHYLFLYEFFKNNINYDIDDDNEFKEQFADFIKDNKNNLNKIFKWTSKHPQQLGCGIDGCAYDIGNNKILKLFSSKISYLNSLNVINEMFNNKHHASANSMIFDSDFLGEFNAYPVYFYIQEKVNTNNKSINYTISNLIELIVNLDNLELKQRDSIQNILENIYDHEEIIYLREKLERECKSKDIFLVNHWFTKLVKDVIINNRKHTPYFDYNSGNVGITDYGTITIFDPSYRNDETADSEYFI